MSRLWAVVSQPQGLLGRAANTFELRARVRVSEDGMLWNVYAWIPSGYKAPSWTRGKCAFHSLTATNMKLNDHKLPDQRLDKSLKAIPQKIQETSINKTNRSGLYSIQANHVIEERLENNKIEKRQALRPHGLIRNHTKHACRCAAMRLTTFPMCQLASASMAFTARLSWVGNWQKF